MKLGLTLIFVFISAYTFAGVSGIGGGSALNKRVTVQVCNQSETGDECRMITYVIRPSIPSAPMIPKCYLGDMSEPCPTVYGVPVWLQKLNSIFEKSELPRLQKP